MKNSNTCPKCASTEILKIPGRIASNGGTNFIVLGFLKYAKVTRYVCENCGYSEEWIDRKSDIEALKRKFGRKDKEK